MATRAAKILLQRSPLFGGLSAPVLEHIASIAVQRRFDSGTLIFSQGDPVDALYCVVMGKIRISAATADGREVFLNVMEAGDSFGEIALLDGRARTATATAIMPCELLAIRRDQFLTVLEREPILVRELLRLCGERLRWTSGLAEDAALLSVEARLAKRLLGLGELRGERQLDGPFTTRISQAELGSFLGISRQIVNQYLQEWKRQGWVELGRGSITVRNPAALKAGTQ
ncbi:MAG: Crp/Fnr family transcriptional regulator [Pseudomonadales bacterium]|nr:Crp/Fnr family transcriptional regulator [Pseudomonadales bacterium]